MSFISCSVASYLHSVIIDISQTTRFRISFTFFDFYFQVAKLFFSLISCPAENTVSITNTNHDETLWQIYVGLYIECLVMFVII